jgi:hypothetical protein
MLILVFALRRPRWPQLFNRLPNRFSYGHPYPLRVAVAFYHLIDKRIGDPELPCDGTLGYASPYQQNSYFCRIHR